MTRYDDRAARGAHVLDHRYRDWDASINVDKLDMADGCYDILGQLFGRFNDGVVHLDLDASDVVYLGFILPLGWERIFHNRNYCKLAVAWKSQVQLRAEKRAEKLAKRFRQVLDEPWLG